MSGLDNSIEGFAQTPSPDAIIHNPKITLLKPEESAVAAKVEAVARKRLIALHETSESTFISEGISKKMSDLEFLSSLEGKLTLSDEEALAIEKLQHKLSFYEEEELTSEIIELIDKIEGLMENSSFAEMVQQSLEKVDLKNALSQIQKDREFVQQFKIKDSISRVDIEKLLVIYRNNAQKLLLENETSTLLDKELSELINSAVFKSSVREIIKNSTSPLSTLHLLDGIRECNLQKNFFEELNFHSKEISNFLCKKTEPLKYGRLISEENELYLEESEKDGTLLGEHEVVALHDSLKNRFSTLLSLLEVEQEYAVEVAHQTFRCKKQKNGSIIIKDPSESYKRTFKDIEFASMFLSINKKMETKEILNPICWCKIPDFTEEQFAQDLSFIQTFEFSDYIFSEYELLGKLVDRIYQDDEYSYHQKEQLIRGIKNKVVKVSKQDCISFIKIQDPVKVLRFLQQLKRLPVKDEFIKQFNAFIFISEIEISARLFTSKEVAKDGINQKNFESEKLEIEEGGANFCCGSMTVAALVERMRKTGKNLNQILEDGVIRHLKLGLEKMSRLSSIEEILAKNGDDVHPYKEYLYETLDSIGKIDFDRYETLLNRIKKESAGVILANTAFFMCAVNKDESVEIFDSHGSSIPLITGTQNPAYRAFFKDTTSAAAYLSVHRRIKSSRYPLLFFPVEVKP